MKLSTGSGAVAQSLARPGVFRFSMAYFLVALLGMFLAFPVLGSLHGGDMIGSAIMTLVLGCGLLAVGGKRRTLAWGLVLCVPAFLGRWLNHLGRGVVSMPVVMGLEMLFVAFVILAMLRHVMTTPVVNSETLCAGVSVYLLLGLFWTFAYMLAPLMNHKAFVFTLEGNITRPLTGFEACYFSFVTLTTMGYGDIIPVGRVVRTLATLEAMIGVLYLTVMVARLVSLYSARESFARPDPDSGAESGRDSRGVS
ncbi:MAG TPA: potassium channel family protein [Verrucomicrobiae bacterium]|nr:potassium channel family protein [Verrucomicrobiae bacterium]